MHAAGAPRECALNPDLRPERIAAWVTGRLGSVVRVLDEVGSTQAAALEWIADGAPEGATVVAEHQTSGRGRRGRTWHSAPGTALLFSVVLRPSVGLDRLGLLSTAAGVGTAEAIRAEIDAPALVKWPNDVVIDGKKVAGILTETKLSGSIVEAAVLGVGVNVRSVPLPPEVATSATSLADHAPAGMRLDRAALLGAVLGAIERRYVQLADDAGAGEVLAAARSLSAVLGARVAVLLGDGERIEGVARDLRGDGALEVEREGTVLGLTVGDVVSIRGGR